MNVKAAAFACTLILSMCPGTMVAAEPGPPTDLSARVRSIFAFKCSECHGPEVQPPKGGVSLHDLGKLAANTDLVVGSRPNESALWEVINNNEMPPSYARAGPLSAQEKETIRAWITSLPPTAPLQSSQPSPPHLQKNIFGWLGRFHILVIHFPIALLVAAALGEMIAAVRGTWIPQPAVRFCVLLGAAGAVLAVAFGWFHADIGGYGSASAGTLALHRWLGTAAGLWATGVALLSESESRRGQRSMLFRSLLWSGAFLLAATAHFGGVMVHGKSFFDW